MLLKLLKNGRVVNLDCVIEVQGYTSGPKFQLSMSDGKVISISAEDAKDILKYLIKD